MKRKKAKVAFLICYDVLVDVFNFFDHLQLAKLEEICVRFNSVVERFNERPFLILELQCRAKVDYDIFSKVLSDPQDIKCGHRSTSGRKVIVCFSCYIFWSTHLRSFNVQLQGGYVACRKEKSQAKRWNCYTGVTKIQFMPKNFVRVLPAYNISIRISYWKVNEKV